MLKKKRDYAIDFLRKNQDTFSCPKCQEKMVVSGQGNMVCQNRHQFDVSKKGIVHFSSNHLHNDYDKDMLTHRRTMIQGGLYTPVIESIAKRVPELQSDSLVVDMGCGEGSFLELLGEQHGLKGAKIGFDLSKDGVVLASDFGPDYFWFVGDVTKVPFKDESAMLLLNIFSPGSYEEMTRVLAPGGRVIKVIPEANYLKELRELFYEDSPEKLSYSNEKVYEKFKQEMCLTHEERITYEFPVSREEQASILKMSPLHWGASKEALQHANETIMEKLTIDVKILVGKKL